ncbi:PREDICTED: calmodulin-like protein 7 isoform X1 [Branchiostoma belcheri]|uniref:Calmodulin-like protein 7 isoform X1 n=2 Tax=Branchiostoma belcheri TaxID=7741 RepID=A0A6P4YYH0_BRABE|nr:PREDICTED: calmodulin-like protein 7 isoform X1 [Branchiostoma belcheri]
MTITYVNTCTLHCLPKPEVILAFAQVKKAHLQNYPQLIMDPNMVFAEMDPNGDGTIESSEIKTFLEQCGINPSEKLVQRVKSKCDANNDGKLTKDEAARIGEVVKEIADLSKVFLDHDQDHNFTMSFDEMKKKAYTFYTTHADKYGSGNTMEVLNFWAGDKTKEMTVGDFLDIMFEDRL